LDLSARTADTTVIPFGFALVEQVVPGVRGGGAREWWQRRLFILVNGDLWQGEVMHVSSDINSDELLQQFPYARMMICWRSMVMMMMLGMLQGSKTIRH